MREGKSVLFVVLLSLVVSSSLAEVDEKTKAWRLLNSVSSQVTDMAPENDKHVFELINTVIQTVPIPELPSNIPWDSLSELLSKVLAFLQTQPTNTIAHTIANATKFVEIQSDRVRATALCAIMNATTTSNCDPMPMGKQLLSELLHQVDGGRSHVTRGTRPSPSFDSGVTTRISGGLSTAMRTFFWIGVTRYAVVGLTTIYSSFVRESVQLKEVKSEAKLRRWEMVTKVFPSLRAYLNVVGEDSPEGTEMKKLCGDEGKTDFSTQVCWSEDEMKKTNGINTNRVAASLSASAIIGVFALLLIFSASIQSAGCQALESFEYACTLSNHESSTCVHRCLPNPALATFADSPLSVCGRDGKWYSVGGCVTIPPGVYCYSDAISNVRYKTLAFTGIHTTLVDAQRHCNEVHQCSCVTKVSSSNPTYRLFQKINSNSNDLIYEAGITTWFKNACESPFRRFRAVYPTE